MSQRTIDRILIEGYKSIKFCDLELGPLNVLIGANGAGKSNFISVFSLLGSIVNKNLAITVGKSGGASTLLRNGPSETNDIHVRAWFGQNQYEVSLGFAQGDALFFQTETCYFHDASKFKTPGVYPLPSGAQESRLKDEVLYTSGPQTVYGYCYDAMKSWQLFHFHDTSATARVKLKHQLDDNRVLRTDAANLAPFLFRLKETAPNSYRLIVDQVRLVAPFFDDFVLEPDELSAEPRIQLQWKHRSNDAFFNAHSLSDGTLRFICLATLLLQPFPPSVIVIDEPELGLHPFAINQLAELLRSASITRQLIISTQSVSLLNQLDLEHVIITEQTEDGSTFERPDLQSLQHWLGDYSIGELWEKNVLGGRPR